MVEDRKFEPIPGNKMFEALYSTGTEGIIMAANTRIVPGIVRGIVRAAKNLRAAVIFELAKSESNLKGGYTGLTPLDFSNAVRSIAKDVGFAEWALHADHITVKKGTEDEMKEVKSLIEAQIAAGYTSFAIDASFLFDLNEPTVLGQLQRNIDVTTELANFIKELMAEREFGLEVEVGEIGKKDKDGLVLTTVAEATTFIKELHKRDVFPNVLAIANGSTHGNIYDEHGNLIEQVSINIERTVEIAKAIDLFKVRVAQHGITGTPLKFISTKFPKGLILKGNVGTFWQNLAWEVFEIFEPELYDDIWNWTLSEYRDEAAKKGITKNDEIFGTYSKFAIKEFKDRIYNVSEETKEALEAKAYAEAMMFFKAFGAVGTADKVKEYVYAQ
ncbi:MAG TPA: class II fructose-bisphosphate aldolase [Candidatus Bathyarchaeia archaeon]|nr:class II fructose-bisphosphate aldolase [Candidatus Bathyarchaeia archaeon]